RLVETPSAARSRDTEHLYRTVRLTVRPSDGGPPEVTLVMSRYRLEPAALYTALVTFSQNAGLREVLGTTHGQARLAAACAPASGNAAEAATRGDGTCVHRPSGARTAHISSG